MHDLQPGCGDHVESRQVSILLYTIKSWFQAWYFDRDDVALPGFYKFFLESSKEEREHAEKFMKYQNSRGGRIVLQNIQVIIFTALILS